MAARSSDLAARLGKQGPFSSPEQEAYLHVLRAHNRLAEPIDRLLRSHGVSQPLYNILRILRGHLGKAGASGRAFHGVPVLRIGEEMVTREPDITRLVDRLEKQSLAVRCRCEEDRRIVYVRITEQGLALLARIEPEIDAIHRRQFGRLGVEELRMLSDLLFRASDATDPGDHPASAR